MNMLLLEIIFFLGFILNKLHLVHLLNPTFFTFPKNNTPNWKVRIIGGQIVAPPNLYPFQVALNINFSGGRTSLCGGSLVAPNWVLTAAHCVDNNPLNIVVILGAHDLSNAAENSRQIFQSNQYFIHSGWNQNSLQNDIALIKLPRNATINENIGIISTATGKDSYAGQIGTVLGWGLTEANLVSNQLRQVDVDIMTNEACRAVNPAYDVMRNTHLCTSGVGIKGSCNGDSGGPLVVNDLLIGLVSFGPQNCTLGLPSVFTRITSYSDWIINITSRNNWIEDNTTGAGSCMITANISLLLLFIFLNYSF